MREEHCESGGRELTVQVTVRTLKPVPHVSEQAPHGLSAQYARAVGAGVANVGAGVAGVDGRAVDGRAVGAGVGTLVAAMQ